MHGVKKSQPLGYAVCYSTFIALCALRFSYLGFKYTPYLDDYIQYRLYPSTDSPWQTVLAGGVGVLYTRPLAGLADFFVWSRFEESLGAAVLLISLMHGLSAIFFREAFQKIGIPLGEAFLVFYAFFPLNTEGTYWLSAATRIVPSLLLTSAALLSLVKGKTLLFALFNFLSLWFYEQTALLSLALGIIFCFSLRQPKKALIPVLGFALTAVFYLIFGFRGDNAQRLSAIAAAKLPYNTFSVLKDFFYALFVVSSRLISNGFQRGIIRIFSDREFVWFGLLGLCAVLFLWLDSVQTVDLKRRRLWLCVALTLIPLIPFFVTDGNALSLRNTVPSALGIAIAFDALIPSIFKRLTPAFCLLILLVFAVCGVSEVCDYECTAQKDLALAEEITAKLPPDAEYAKIRISSPDYYPQNAPFGDHIKSMTASDWGTNGIVRTLSGNKDLVIDVEKQ